MQNCKARKVLEEELSRPLEKRTLPTPGV